MQDGIDDAFADGDHLRGAVADGLDDLVAVHFLVLKQAEDEELGDAIHEVRIGFAGRHWRHYTLEFKVLQEECSGADSCGLRRDAPVLGWGPARHVWQKS